MVMRWNLLFLLCVNFIYKSDCTSPTPPTTKLHSTTHKSYHIHDLSNAAKGGLIATGAVFFVFCLFGVIYCRRVKAYQVNQPAYYNDIRLNRPVGMRNDEYEEESDCDPLFENHVVIG